MTLDEIRKRIAEVDAMKMKEKEKKLLLRACRKLNEHGLQTAILEKAINLEDIQLLKSELKRLYEIASSEQKERLDKFAKLVYILDWR
ncbi:MAG: hypothetical protein QW540_08150 [Archaeoglobaceae archaeon]